jgi:hypothetical protein
MTDFALLALIGGILLALCIALLIIGVGAGRMSRERDERD